jgi:hypothetical protein
VAIATVSGCIAGAIMGICARQFLFEFSLRTAYRFSTDGAVVCGLTYALEGAVYGMVTGAAAGSVIILLRARAERRSERLRCRSCGYLLVGLESDRCPECGNAISR